MEQERMDEVYIKSVYDYFVKKYPRLGAVRMTDAELEECLSRDLEDAGEAHFWLNNNLKRPFDRISIDILKVFYETGEQQKVDEEYLDHQLDYIIFRAQESENFKLWGK